MLPAVLVHGVGHAEAHEHGADHLQVHEEGHLPHRAEDDRDQGGDQVEVQSERVHYLPQVHSLVDQELDREPGVLVGQEDLVLLAPVEVLLELGSGHSFLAVTSLLSLGCLSNN